MHLFIILSIIMHKMMTLTNIIKKRIWMKKDKNKIIVFFEEKIFRDTFLQYEVFFLYPSL